MRLFLLLAMVSGCAAMFGMEDPQQQPADDDTPDDVDDDDDAPDDASSIGVDVTIDDGALRGYADGDLRVFKGIPYAAPPIGALRFASTQAAVPWTSRRLAVDDPAVCPQNASALSSTVIGDEDCLTVSVWTHATATQRPVMVFVHGGAGVGGEHYNAAALARRTGNVVVTVQYRLGMLGHIALPELPATNLALLDQQQALRWVRDNITVFGGDPGRVMLFGESQGAHYTCAHTVAPQSGALFHVAIAESGACFNADTPAVAIASWEPLVTAAGCEGTSRVGCLRSKTAAELVTATGGYIPRLISDGTILPDPATATLAGDIANVPLVVGSNVNEASMFIGLYLMSAPWLMPLLDSQWGYETAVGLFDPAHANQLLALYPYASYGSGIEALDALGTDVAFACPVREWARAWHLAGGTVWQYEFTPPLRGALAPYGSTHGFELAFVFDAWDTVGYAPNPDERALSDWMQDTWGTIAATGAPAAGWSPYAWPDETHLEIGFARGERQVFRDGRCDQLVQLGVVARPTAP